LIEPGAETFDHPDRLTTSDRMSTPVTTYSVPFVPTTVPPPT
jgi:hypothetical protein